MENILVRDFHLTKREARLYIALLQLGPSVTGVLSKHTSIPNAKIYDVLQTLQDKGLIQYHIEGRARRYSAASVDALKVILQSQQKEAERVLLQLQKLQLQVPETPGVHLFVGLPAIRSLFRRLVEGHQRTVPWRGFTTGESSSDETVRAFYDWLGLLKRDHKIKDRLLVTRVYAKRFRKLHPAHSSLWAVKASDVSFPGDVAILEHAVILLVWTVPYQAVVIESEAVQKQYVQFFEHAWKHGG